MKRARTPIDTSSRETRTAAAFKSAFVCGIAVLGLLFLAAAFQPAPPETVSVIVQAESLEAAIAVVREAGGEVTALHCDAREEAEVEALFEKIETEIGPLSAVVFNVGGNVRFPILETTSRVYRKVWEMCAYAGFLVGREAARAMVPRGAGSILFTGATASIRGASGFSAFAGGKHALRALAQSMARELMPKNIHVGHVVIDGPIDTEWTRERFPDLVEERPKDGLLQPEDIAENYWNLHAQKRSAWTLRIEGPRQL